VTAPPPGSTNEDPQASPWPALLSAIVRLAAVVVVLGAVFAIVGFTLVGGHGGGGVQRWDDSVGTWFQTHRFHLVGASKVIAFLGDAPNLAVLVAAGTIVLLLVGQRIRAFIPLAAYLGAEFLVFLTRTYIHRPRPLSANYLGPGSLPGIHETSWSFPSGHATAGTAVVVSLAGLAVLTWKVRWPWIVGIAVGAMVATSRLVLGAHWWSDVTSGLVVGVVWGITVTLALADCPGRSRGLPTGSRSNRPPNRCPGHQDPLTTEAVGRLLPRPTTPAPDRFRTMGIIDSGPITVDRQPGVHLTGPSGCARFRGPVATTFGSFGIGNGSGRDHDGDDRAARWPV